jgi:hypothetical protein
MSTLWSIALRMDFFFETNQLSPLDGAVALRMPGSYKYKGHLYASLEKVIEVSGLYPRKGTQISGKFQEGLTGAVFQGRSRSCIHFSFFFFLLQSGVFNCSDYFFFYFLLHLHLRLRLLRRLHLRLRLRPLQLRLLVRLLLFRRRLLLAHLCLTTPLILAS